MAFIGDLFISVETLPANGFGFVQLLFLGAAYAYVLMFGSTLIKDGSELLLLLPAWAGIVGPIVLPVLGAVPDGAIVLFSGLGPDAQKQLSVGIGALAGSTIMLLTVPWALSQYAGRVNIDPDGNGNYIRPRAAGKEWKKLNPPNKFLGTGVNFSPAIDYGGRIMLLTALPFFVIQIPSIFARCSLTNHESDCDTPLVAALIGGVMCILLFGFYLFDQYRLSATDEKQHHRIDVARQKAVGVHASLLAIFGDHLAAAAAASGEPSTQADGATGGASETTALVTPRGVTGADGSRNTDAVYWELHKFLRPHFQKYDIDHDNTISAHELTQLLIDVGEVSKVKSEASHAAVMVEERMRRFDTDASGSLEYPEFVAFVLDLLRRRAAKTDAEVVVDGDSETDAARSQPRVDAVAGGHDDEAAAAVGEAAEGADAAEEEDEEEMPEDIAALPVEQQKRAILRRSMFLMIVGTLIVLLFSDPMVDVLSELGNRIHLSPFYVAFVLAPLVSNGSELIAAYAYASKKTEASITISFSTLLGAACMNNTFCLAIFLWIVYLKQLKWVFIAEVMVILVVELIMFALVFRKLCMSSSKMAIVIALLPASLALVAILENVAGLD